MSCEELGNTNYLFSSNDFLFIPLMVNDLCVYRFFYASLGSLGPGYYYFFMYNFNYKSLEEEMDHPFGGAADETIENQGSLSA